MKGKLSFSFLGAELHVQFHTILLCQLIKVISGLHGGSNLLKN